VVVADALRALYRAGGGDLGFLRKEYFPIAVWDVKKLNREPRQTGEREFKCAEGMAEDLQFEKAALLRDQIQELKHMLDGTKSEAKPVSYRKSKRARG
jgi:hypothetical protein